MTRPVAKIHTVRKANPALPDGTVLDTDNPDHWVPDGRALLMWCPGCDDLHRVAFVGEDGTHPAVEWDVSGSLERSTVAPSILVHSGGGRSPRCHSFVRDGRWEFLSDCDHDLAGQTVDMVPLPFT